MPNDTPRKTIQELYDVNPYPRRMTKARKNHWCDICNETIAMGNLYYAETVYPGIWNENETIFTYRAHPDCDVLWRLFGEKMDWEWPWSEGWLYWLDILDEAHVEYPTHWRQGQKNP